MTARATLATARRVLLQLRSDHRTIALLMVVPVLLLTLLRMLDVAFALVTLVVAGPIEGFFQNRRPR